MTELRAVTRSEEETAEAAERLASTLLAGDVVILSGSLGSGKTAFVRGLARGLGIDPRAVHSPTFTIVTEYGAGRSGLRLVHVDLYRIDRAEEVVELGLSDYQSQGCILAVEWGERLPERLRTGAIHVTLEDAGGEERRLTIDSDGATSPHSSPSQ
ncbi:MAG TPA: tRNA (adenosine(37)-N6)-threonylcarbamoyltransferase complex ATPase subunit type 1 TsaE [Candidatus Polarisedimenticolia bacterium]|nr:tRNA (adenosine(37)-N6)-threonylcarbamoyltransferase complex ATPase subunit type 1 TsaE [Candidatus Polarisedimenticolia bacterium]